MPTLLPTPTDVISSQTCPNIVKSYTYQGITIGYGLVPGTGNYAWYMLSSTSDFNDFNAKVDKIFRNFAEAAQHDENIITAHADYTEMFREYSLSPCPKRFTAVSPTIFLYGAAGSTYTVSLPQSLLYADPKVDNNQWKIEVEDRGLNINGVNRDYIYYEYEKIAFERPSKGWDIRRSEINIFARRLGEKLELNTKESERLLYEITHAASDVAGEHLFIGLIDDAEIRAKLPLEVSPVPMHTARLHFYIAQPYEKVQTPVIVPV